MTKPTGKKPARVLREHGARYVVGAQGQPVAVLLTLKEYDRYLDLLDDEADSLDTGLAARLAQVPAKPRQKRLAFRDYMHRREASRGPVSR